MKNRYLIFAIFHAFGRKHTEHFYFDEPQAQDHILKIILKQTSCPTAGIEQMFTIDLQDLKTEKNV